jgi:hypothetical protein
MRTRDLNAGDPPVALVLRVDGTSAIHDPSDSRGALTWIATRHVARPITGRLDVG